MDAAKLQTKIYKGYGKAAQRIGYMSDIYRPNGAVNPITTANKTASLYASFNAQDMTYGKPNGYGKSTFYVLVDGNSVNVGDYITNPHDGTFFVAAMQQALPILCVQCNTTVSITRSYQEDSMGIVGYGGLCIGESVDVLVDWPCSMLIGAGGTKNPLNLPGDVQLQGFQILIPYVAGVEIVQRDIVTTKDGQRYVAFYAERTDLGWRVGITSVAS